jgi:hypothetical protein
VVKNFGTARDHGVAAPTQGFVGQRVALANSVGLKNETG